MLDLQPCPACGREVLFFTNGICLACGAERERKTNARWTAIVRWAKRLGITKKRATRN